MASQEGILAYTQPLGAAAPAPAAPAPAAPTYYPPSPYYPSSMPSAYYPEAYAYHKKKKSDSGLMIATCVLLLLLIIWLLYYLSPARVLTRRLVRAGWILYTKPGCPFCVRQEAVLRGKFWKKVTCPGKGKELNLYAMTDNAISCDDPSITGFPYWYNHLRPGRSSAGLKSWSELQRMAK